MSKYERLECKCGHTYVTKETSSICPNCGKTNLSTTGGLFAIGIVIAIAIFIGLLFGAIGWAIYALQNKLGKWHFLGVCLSGVAALIFFGVIIPYDEYPILNWMSYILNGSAVLFGGFMFFKNFKN
jgi:RNA polymerase subunit RPABC4/transcription elongation factor Spt4